MINHKNGTLEKYSVLMSVYEKEVPQYLRESINSMIGQTVKPDQIVIVEDGKLTEALYEVLDSFSQEYDGLIERVSLSTNQGLGHALDVGMQFCRNELIARMDSDDISIKDRCQKQLEVFVLDNSLDIVSGTIVEFINNIDNVVYRRVVPELNAEIKKQMRRRSPFNHPAVMYKKSSVIRCGGYGSSARKEDHDLFSRMLNMGCKAYNLQEDLLFYRTGTDSIKRRKSWKNVRSYIEIMWINLNRGYCGMDDFLYVCIAQIFYLIAPAPLLDIIIKHCLRSTDDKR